MSSSWRHSICVECWNKLNPGRQTHTLREEFRDEKPDVCCFCRKAHGSGIFIREDPAKTLCGGTHATDAR